MDDSGTKRIESTSPKAVFAQLVACALGKAEIEPSPMATAYLVELLDERIRSPESVAETTPSLAEQLLTAQRDSGAVRIRKMRNLGDRALFVSGFFGDSLARKLVDIDYYRQVGRTAYGDVANRLAGAASGRNWTRLYRELSGRFGEFVDVLAEIAEQSRPDCAPDRSRLYDRFLLTGSERDRRRLVANGQLSPDRRGLDRWQ